MLSEPVQDFLLRDRLRIAVSECRQHPFELQATIICVLCVPFGRKELVCVLDEFTECDLLRTSAGHLRQLALPFLTIPASPYI
jgi:hypothetical protein